MPVSFVRTGIVPASPETIFDTWIDGDGHASMTGAAATSDGQEGGTFRAWDGFISGTYTALERPRRLTFDWRTTAFDADAADSKVEVLLAPHTGGTEVTIRHQGIPDGQPDYDQGWLDHYLSPMARHWG